MSYGNYGDGGFEQSSQQQNDADDGGKKKSGERGMLPVTIRQLIDAHVDEVVKVDGREANQVTFVGQIVDEATTSVSTTFRITDTTGEIEVNSWIDNEETEENVRKRAQWVTGAYVRVVGNCRLKPNSQPPVKSVMAFHIRKIDDFNELTYHLLDSVHAHLYNTQGPKDSLPPAGSNFASPGKPSMGPGSRAPVAGAGAAVAAFSNPAGGTGAGMNVDDVVMKAFESLPEGGGEGTGLSVVDIARWCSQQMGREIPRTAVMKVVDKMCLEGLTYSTIDEEHYAKI